MDTSNNSSINLNLKEKTIKKNKEQNDKEKERQILKNIVLGGGGVRGFSYLGLLKLFEEYNLYENIKVIVGTSSGSIVATAICLGYTYQESLNYICPFTIGRLINITATTILNFTESYGLDKGDKLESFIKKAILQKGFSENITFKQLYDISKKHLIITTTCLKNKQCFYLDYKTFPNMPIWIACRASCSLPILYEPVKFQDYLFIDGSVMDNIPLYKFESEIENSMAFRFMSNTDNNTLIGYVRNISTCFKNYDPNSHLTNRIIEINISHIETMQDIDLDTLHNMIDICYKQTKQKFIEVKFI
jgi:NTE family protein